MSKKIKILTVVGTRPEIIRLSRVIHKLDTSTDHVLVHSGQNYDFELNEIFFRDLEIRKPNYILDTKGETASEFIASNISQIDKILKNEKPDAMLVLGDTNSGLSVIPAKRRKIPIFHMEAGNRCFDDRVPEEINRRIIDHTADINLPYSSLAREHLIREGLPPDQIIKTGSPMYEVLNFYEKKINNSKILRKLNLNSLQYFLVSFHREENIDNEENFDKFISILNKLSEKYNFPIIVSTHPRTRNRINEKKYEVSKNVNFLKPLSFSDYNKLQKEAKVVLSDSGTINEEASILNFPALNMRESFERPEAMEEASTMMVGLNYDVINNSLIILEEQLRNENRILKVPNDYQIDNVSEKIVRIIISYIDYVKKKTWKDK